MRVEIDGGASGDLLRSLHTALSGEPEWRGRVRLVEGSSRPEALGSLLEALAVALAPGGVAVGLVSAVVAWARRQSVGDVVCKLSRPDGTSVEVSAPLARSLRGADEVRALVEDLTERLESGSSGSDTPSGE
ncbi:effector-associated constant component EACC1 [Streptomyces sp. 2-1]|uniref:effector-associated constant component EACC1 n=1 Tax=Streptomyces sp. 2-1 TaxID=412710 RepID=UPI003AFB60F3